MAEGIGVTASIIAVLNISVKAGSLCLQYTKDIQNANEDASRLRDEVFNLQHIIQSTGTLLRGPHGRNLRTAQQLHVALRTSQFLLEKLVEELSPRTGRNILNRIGFNNLKWPLEKNDTKLRVQDLARCAQAISQALQIDQTSILLDHHQRQTLKHLPIVLGAAFDSNDDQHLPKCHPDTRRDLLRLISDWAFKDHTQSVFWLNGMAGTGKTTISRTLAHSFHQNGRLGGSFFFRRAEGDRSSGSKVFTTLASQLIHLAPMFANNVQDALEADPYLPTKGMQDQFDKLILEPLKNTKRDAWSIDTLVIIIDALDECERDDDIRLIIKLLSRFSTSSFPRVRAFVTSRPEIPVRLGFRQAQLSGSRHGYLVLHDLPIPTIKRDISAYLHLELSRVKDDYNALVPEDHQLPEIWPKPSEIEVLVGISIPLFIVAATIVRYLADMRTIDSPDKKLLSILKHRTIAQNSRLSATYLPVLEQMTIGLSRSDANEVLTAFRDIVGSIVILESPLSPSALAKLLNTDCDTICGRLNLLHSVLDVPDSTESPIRLLHLSFRDFLLDPTRSESLFWIEKKEVNIRLAAHCLRVMAEVLQQDICLIRCPGTRRSSIDQRLISDNLVPEVQYACQYWVNHLNQGGDCIHDGGAVDTFLRQHFLHWVEILSLLGKMSDGVASIRTLQFLLKPGHSIRLSLFLNDALRFLLVNLSLIQDAPLQVYDSAIALSPHSSIIYHTFKEPCILRTSLYLKGDEDCADIFQLPDGHGVGFTSSAFSPDGEMIAATLFDKTVQIWTSMGKYVQTLEGHCDGVLSVTFSPSGRTIASASFDKTIRFWKKTGECIQILEGHSDSVRSVTFSPDEALVASSSWDKTVRLWTATTGDCVQTLVGHGDSVTSVAFSPDGQTVASASWDRTVRLWTATTGDCSQTLLGHSDSVSSVAFSPDGQTVASASWDRTVRLWTATTGVCFQTLVGHTDSIRSVMFSADGKILASASHDRTIRLWTVAISECVKMSTPLTKAPRAIFLPCRIISAFERPV